ncbi:small ribosomal subunit Rsm22 family protein [Microbacteriaceae bacterium K1510]|nr:small ribosomal subunit Rsm22 family protein [Microbacteriaceae bacterium K1510]
MTALPAFLGAALANKLENVSRAALRGRAKTISETYRSGGGSSVIRTQDDSLAYALVRMPATYAAVRAALTQAIDVVPDFAPRSLLDVGAGPGTASWAAADAWPSLERITLIDSNPRLLDLAEEFRQAPGAPQAGLSAMRGNIADALGQASAADVVMASYVLTEMAIEAAVVSAAALWRLAEKLLVIVEPGTPDGFKRILRYRDLLLAQGASIIAPCSHESICPLSTGDRWCHFSARLPRSRDHLLTKGASVPFEDEKFSYLVAGKGFDERGRGRRILATPRVGKAAISLTLCAPEAPADITIARGDKDAYKAAKRLDWGDALRT